MMTMNAPEISVKAVIPHSILPQVDGAGLPGFLTALQLGDSTLPVGSFSFSNGLETAVQLGIVHDAATLEDFIKTAVEQSAHGDGVALLESHRGMLAGDLDRIILADRASYNRKLNEEIRVMSIRMGKKLAEMSLYLSPDQPVLSSWLDRVKTGDVPGTYAAAQGAVFAGMQLSEQVAFAVQQYGVASMMVGAALRMVKMNYLDGQKILISVNQLVEPVYQAIKERTIDDMASYAPMIDILAGIHVKSKIRMFMN